MAERPVFYPVAYAPYWAVESVDFVWNSGLSKSQKQKNIVAIHNAYKARRPERKVLEISSKSLQEHGVELSAFSLMKYVPSLDSRICVESIYHAGKVFYNGGPYLDLMQATAKEAKHDARLSTSGPLVGFYFEENEFPCFPQNLFYDYLYMNALLENPELAKVVLSYDAFTDIEFNPNKSINCQARAAAHFVALNQLGLLDEIRDVVSYLRLHGVAATKVGELRGRAKAVIEPWLKAEEPENPSFTVRTASKKTRKSRSEKVAAAKQDASDVVLADVEDDAEDKEAFASVGDILVHKKFGEGKILMVNETSIEAEFAGVGKKSLGLKWCEKNCSVKKP